MFTSPTMTENKAVLFSHARVNPTGDCPQGCFYFSCSLSWGVFSCASAHVLPSQGWEKQTPLRAGCPGEPQARISLEPLPAWLHLLSSCSACSLSAREVCRSLEVPTTVKTSFSWFAGRFLTTYAEIHLQSTQ